MSLGENRQLMKEMVRLYQSGFDIYEVGDRIGISRSSVQRLLHEEGIKPHKKGFRLNREKIIELYKSGMYSREIAKIFNITQSTVSVIVKNAGIEAHKKPCKASSHKIIELYNSGLTQHDVGKLVGLGQAGIGYHLKKNKIKSHRKFNGELNSNWKGGIIYDRGRKSIYSPSHPKPDRDKYCYEYRLIMEKHLGRYLNDDEIVHHINGDHTDNRIENLQVMTRREHILLHIKQGDMIWH